MTKTYPPQAEHTSDTRYLIQLVSHEIKLLHPHIRDQMNPFIYLLAVKNLVFIGKIGLLLKLEERRSLPVTSVLVYRELDMALAEDSVFNSRKQSPEEFAAFFIEVLLPERRLELYLKRDD